MSFEFYQAIYQPENPKKYIGSKLPYFRSSWEKRLFTWLDKNNNVIRWSSENIVIPYFYEIDQKVHRYTPDVYAEIIDRNGNTKKYLIEIKPKKQTIEPKKPKNKNAKALLRYSKAQQEYVKNKNKWAAALTFCRKSGMEFKLMTEDVLF